MTTALVKQDQVKQTGLALVTQAEELQVVDQASFEAAARFRTGVLKWVDQITAQWAPAVKAAHEAHRATLKQRDDWCADYLRAAAIVGTALAEFEAKARAEVRRQEQALAKQAQAAAAEAKGPVMVPPVTATVPKADGLGFRDQWSAHVTDLMKLVRAVAAGEQPLALLEPNMTALNGLARSLKDEMKVPGVEARDARVPVRQ
jgi:hypothetical protein